MTLSIAIETFIILFDINHLFAAILNDFKYCYQTLIILFNINHLFAHS